MLVLGTRENGKELVVKAGQSLAVELDSNPATGYKWNWKVRPNPALLKLEKEYYRPRTTRVVILGGGGMETWVFRALDPGSTTLELEYRRPWEDKPPQARFVLDITIINH